MYVLIKLINLNVGFIQLQFNKIIRMQRYSKNNTTEHLNSLIVIVWYIFVTTLEKLGPWTANQTVNSILYVIQGMVWLETMYFFRGEIYIPNYHMVIDSYVDFARMSITNIFE